MCMCVCMHRSSYGVCVCVFVCRFMCVYGLHHVTLLLTNVQLQRTDRDTSSSFVYSMT